MSWTSLKIGYLNLGLQGQISLETFTILVLNVFKLELYNLEIGDLDLQGQIVLQTSKNV